MGPAEFALDLEILLDEARKGGFWSYSTGVAAEVLKKYPGRVQGARIDNYKTTLPVKKGLSSSAAVCVMVARAFNALYDLSMTVMTVFSLLIEL